MGLVRGRGGNSVRKGRMMGRVIVYRRGGDRVRMGRVIVCRRKRR